MGRSMQEDTGMDMGRSMQEDTGMDMGRNMQEGTRMGMGRNMPEDTRMDMGNSNMAGRNKDNQDSCWIKYVAQAGDTLQDIYDRSACSKEMFWDKNRADMMYMLPGVAYFILENDVD